MSQVCLVVFCGLPAAGKTYLIRKLKSCEGLKVSKTFRLVSVEYDRLLPPHLEKILIESEEHTETSWKKYRTEIVKCVDLFLSQILDSRQSEKSLDLHTIKVPNGFVSVELWKKFISTLMEGGLMEVGVEDVIYLVIDDNMYYRSMRYAYYQLARKYTIGFCEIYVKLDVETAILQNHQREIKVTNDVVITMATKMEAPDRENHKWEENSMVVSTDVDVEEVCSVITRAILNPVHPVEEPDYELQNQSRLLCSENLLYQSDIILRRLVSQEMASAKDRKLSGADLKTYAESLQSARKHLLADLKCGSVDISSDLVSMATNASKDTENALFRFLQDKFEIYFKEIER